MSSAAFPRPIISICSNWASYNPYVRLVVKKIFYLYPSSFRLDPFFWIFISPRCKASSRKTSFFLLHLSFFLLKEDKRYPLSKGRLSYTTVIRAVGGAFESCGALPLP